MNWERYFKRVSKFLGAKNTTNCKVKNRIDAFFAAKAVGEVETENLNRKKKVSVFFFNEFFSISLFGISFADIEF